MSNLLTIVSLVYYHFRERPKSFQLFPYTYKHMVLHSIVFLYNCVHRWKSEQTKTHWTTPFKWMNCICEFHFNKAVYKKKIQHRGLFFTASSLRQCLKLKPMNTYSFTQLVTVKYLCIPKFPEMVMFMNTCLLAHILAKTCSVVLL